MQEAITRVLLERLIVHRPHPWGLLITFIELIKNPRCDPMLGSTPLLLQVSLSRSSHRSNCFYIAPPPSWEIFAWFTDVASPGGLACFSCLACFWLCRYEFWSHPFTRCAPEISHLFENVARSCVPGGAAAADGSGDGLGDATSGVANLSLSS